MAEQEQREEMQEVLEAASGGYLVQITDKRRFTRLHKRGGCWRRVGRELKSVQYYDRLEDHP